MKRFITISTTKDFWEAIERLKKERRTSNVSQVVREAVEKFAEKFFGDDDSKMNNRECREHNNQGEQK